MKKLLVIGMMVLAACNASSPASLTPTAAGPPAAAGDLATATESKKETGKPSQAAVEETVDHANLLNKLLFSISSREEGQAILDEIEATGDTRFVAGLIDTLRYQTGLSIEIGATLNALTGQDLPPDWFAWVEWAGQHPDIESFAGYPGWKGHLFAQIDPQFLRFVHAGMKVDPGSRVEEIVWGGVRVDGIPALDNPKMVAPEEASYLVPEERVFGVSLNGDSRAYPARFLDWHEMFNDIVGGEPVSLAY